MNGKKFILVGCAAACVFAASTATAQMRGHGGSMRGMGMRGAPMSHSMGMRGGFTPHSMGGMPMQRAPMAPSMGRMPMQRAPMMNSPSGLRRFGDRGFNPNDRFRRFNRFNDFNRNDRFRRFNRFNNFDRDDRFNRFRRFDDDDDQFIFIGNFGFPWWWGWGWGPWWGGGWGYPYGYYGGGYGSGYGYGDSSGSRVAELQSRLARAGYYHGAIDGIMGPATRRAIRAYERDHGSAG
jgi:Putative peptidoglycan binding domain